MKKFRVYLPNWVSSFVCYGLNRKDAIARFRKNQGFLRMPKGYDIWEEECIS